MLTERIVKEKLSQVFINNAHGNQLRRQPKNRWWKCIQIDIQNVKLQIGKRGKKTELTGRSPSRRQWSALDCSVI